MFPALLRRALRAIGVNSSSVFDRARVCQFNCSRGTYYLGNTKYT